MDSLCCSERLSRVTPLLVVAQAKLGKAGSAHKGYAVVLFKDERGMCADPYSFSLLSRSLAWVSGRVVMSLC
jgi:hypothetical protein